MSTCAHVPQDHHLRSILKFRNISGVNIMWLYARVVLKS